MKPTIKHALIDALGTALYICAVASFLFYIPKRFAEEADTVLAPIAMLMLLVFSAAVTGSLVFGKPILWYLKGEKKEALLLVGYTLGFFFLITLLVLGLLIFLR